MSSYSCVLPINWSILWERVLPAWLSVLAGSIEASEFYARFVPAGDMYEDLLDDDYSSPEDYLCLFTKHLHPPYLRSDLLASGKCSVFLENADSSSYLLEGAIKQTAAVNLPGIDPYAGNYFAESNERSRKFQVAGTKNLYDFLERAFKVNYVEDCYIYSRRLQGVSPRLQELLESLFLYQRAIPGAWFLPNSPAWPAFDDLSFAGYLSPEEVKSLRDELASWDDSSLAEDELFQLFTNRVTRTADFGGGLLTIHAGL